MKTQWSIINEILSGINIVQAIVYEKYFAGHCVDFKCAKQLFQDKLSFSKIGQYVLPLLKQGLKEALGFEMDVEVLIILIGGYFLSVKNVFTKSALIKRISYRQSANNDAYPEAA